MVDVISGESMWVCEKTASKAVSVGDWLATFVKHIDGQTELEGLIVSLVPGTRRPAMEALLSSHRDLEITSGSPETRRCALEVVAAVRTAEQALSESQQDVPVLTASQLRKELGLEEG